MGNDPDVFDLMVRSHVYFWMGEAAAGKLHLDEKGWRALENFYDDAWGKAFRDRLPAKNIEKKDWWNAKGRKYSRSCVRKFVEILIEIEPTLPAEDDIQQAYEETKSQMLAVLERAGSGMLGDILCPS